MADAPPISLRVRDAAALIGMGERYVWDLVLTGQLPSFRQGTRRLIRYVDAKAYIDEQFEQQHGPAAKAAA